MDRTNYNVYQLQLPQVSVWILQTAEDVAEAFRVVQEDKEHVYHEDHRTRTTEPFFPTIPAERLNLEEAKNRVYWQEQRGDRWGVERTVDHEAFGLNSAIITSSNGQALITSLISPSSWPEFLLRPAARPVP